MTFLDDISYNRRLGTRVGLYMITIGNLCIILHEYLKGYIIKFYIREIRK